MQADLVAFCNHAPLLVRIEQGGDGRYEEGRRNRGGGKRFENTRHALAIAILALRHAADGFAAVAQLIGLVVAIERKCHGATRAALPGLRLQRPARANLLDLAAPGPFFPFPWFHMSDPPVMIMPRSAKRERLRAAAWCSRAAGCRRSPRHRLLRRSGRDT
ncbi:hypothetical protein D3C80_1583430 [compost metagenome]